MPNAEIKVENLRGEIERKIIKLYKTIPLDFIINFNVIFSKIAITCF